MLKIPRLAHVTVHRGAGRNTKALSLLRGRWLKAVVGSLLRSGSVSNIVEVTVSVHATQRQLQGTLSGSHRNCKRNCRSRLGPGGEAGTRPVGGDAKMRFDRWNDELPTRLSGKFAGQS